MMSASTWSTPYPVVSLRLNEEGNYLFSTGRNTLYPFVMSSTKSHERRRRRTTCLRHELDRVAGEEEEENNMLAS